MTRSFPACSGIPETASGQRTRIWNWDPTRQRTKRKRGLEVVSRRAENLRPNAAADKAARKDSDTCRTLDWTTPTNLVDRQLSAVLKQLAPGETSYVLERADSFRIVRVTGATTREDANRLTKSNRRSAESSSRKCCNGQSSKMSYHKATIESPYLPGSQTKSPKKGEPASSMNDPSIELFQDDLYEGLNVPESCRPSELQLRSLVVRRVENNRQHGRRVRATGLVVNGSSLVGPASLAFQLFQPRRAH